MDDESVRRAEAIKRLKARRDFKSHLVVYVLVNALLVLIWAVSGAGYFWPIWPIAGWGLGVVLNGWDVYFRRPISEDEIRREMEKRF